MKRSIMRYGLKALAAAVISVCAIAGGTAFAQDAPAFPAGTTMDRIAKAGKIRIGTKYDQPLLSQKNLSGKLEGFDVDLATYIAGQLGVKPENIEWVETVSANREPFLQQEKVDFVITSYAITDKRKQVISFAGPYITDGQTLAVKKGNPLGIKTPDDLAGRKVCAVAGSAAVPALQKFSPKAIQVSFDSQSKCIEALKNGAVDAMSSAWVIYLGYISRDPSAFDMLDAPYTIESYGIGIKKADVAFCQFLDDTLKKAYATGVYDKAYQDNLGKYTTRKMTMPDFEPCS